jgi:hypothetical protein
MAYWNRYVYVLSDGDALRQFAVINGKLPPRAASAVPGVSATPTLSANSLDDGIVWLLHSKVWNAPDQPAALYAYDAANMAHELYNSEQNAGRDPPRPCPTVQHPDGRERACICRLKARGRCLWPAARSMRAHGTTSTNWHRFGVFGL